MFDLEHHIEDWRNQLLQRESVSPKEVDELECHLRDAVDELSAMVNPDEAFLLAARRVGSPDAIALEFSKINGARTWARRAQWMLAGYLVLSLGLGLIGTITRGLMIFASTLGVPFWIAGAISSLGIATGIVGMIFWVWQITNGNSLGLQSVASGFAKHAKSGRKWWLVAGVLLLVLAKNGVAVVSSVFVNRLMQPEEFAITSLLTTTTNWAGSLLMFGTIAALLCWLVNHDGESRRMSQSTMIIAASLAAVLVLVTYGLILAGMPIVYGSAYSLI